VRPWSVVGEIAAAIHAVPGTDVEDIVPGATTRRDHALESIAALAELAPIEMRDAHVWALEHLPPAEPSALLHGDLLGQNISDRHARRQAAVPDRSRPRAARRRLPWRAARSSESGLSPAHEIHSMRSLLRRLR
jgi:hypothetical protein